MKKKKILYVLVTILVIVAAFAVWYIIPTHFLGGVEASDITKIYVFDGNTGKGFDITDEEEIAYIVDNIKETKLEKGMISLGNMGYSLEMSFYNEKDKEIESFILNSDDTIRDDPFSYWCDGGLCYEYIKELEGDYVKD